MAVKNRGKTDLMRRSRRGPGTSRPATPSFPDTSFSQSMAGVDASSVTAPTADTFETTDFT